MSKPRIQLSFGPRRSHCVQLLQFVLRPQSRRVLHLFPTASGAPSTSRTFTSTPNNHSWLAPKRGHTKKSPKGRCRVPIGGSTRGTTVVWGDYGLRLRDHDRRISAKHLQIGSEAIKRRLRGERFRFFTRVAANIGVYASGNETRMGKGKGDFDFWAARVAVSQIVFEVSGNMHEQVARDALRLAGNKMPGQWEFVKKGEPPVMGLTKMTAGVTLADLKKPRRPLVGDITAGRIPASMPTHLPDTPAPTSAAAGTPTPM